MQIAEGNPAPGCATTPRCTAQPLLSIRRWTDALVSLRIGRPHGFRFTAGHYARLGIGPRPDGAVWRPYSIASATDDAQLEFLIVRVPGGAFSQRLETMREAGTVFVEQASYGFLTVGQLAPGRALWLLASGTGIGPYLSILREPAVWRDFERIVVAHSVRRSAELAYREEIAVIAQQAARSGAGASLRYLPVVTREPGATPLDARLPALLATGRLEQAAGAPMEVETSRVMACGNPELTRELRAMLSARGFRTGRRGVRGQMAFENYW